MPPSAFTNGKKETDRIRIQIKKRAILIIFFTIKTSI